MTPTSDHPEGHTTSEISRPVPQAMSIVGDTEIEKSKLEGGITLLDTESDYGDFANDAEELEIIDSLLSQAENWQGPNATSLLVTDIEDYEPPHGVRLPKILGIEQTLRLWEAAPGQILQDSSTPNRTSYLVLSQYTTD
jgi:hypothetical protein